MRCIDRRSVTKSASLKGIARIGVECVILVTRITIL